jgi:hypothetical protein
MPPATPRPSPSATAEASAQPDHIKDHPAFPDAGGATITSILGALLFVAGWRRRSRALGWLSMIAGVFVALPVLLFILGYGRWRAWVEAPTRLWADILAPSFRVVAAPAPAGIPFLIGVAVGVALAVLTGWLIGWLRPPPTPTAPDFANLWEQLAGPPRVALTVMWHQANMWLLNEDMEEPRAQFGIPVWNTVEQKLRQQELIKVYPHDWRLTEKGKALLAWATDNGKLSKLVPKRES